MTGSGARMPFGKHRGELVRDLPDEYLSWLLDEVDIQSERLRLAIETEAERRRYEAEHEEPRRFFDRLNAPRPEVADELIGAGLRSLARRYHPDATGGGSSAKMAELNQAADWLKLQARQVA